MKLAWNTGRPKRPGVTLNSQNQPVWFLSNNYIKTKPILFIEPCWFFWNLFFHLCVSPSIISSVGIQPSTPISSFCKRPSLFSIFAKSFYIAKSCYTVSACKWCQDLLISVGPDDHNPARPVCSNGRHPETNQFCVGHTTERDLQSLLHEKHQRWPGSRLLLFDMGDTVSATQTWQGKILSSILFNLFKVC